MPATAAQTAANQANARLSTGPVTLEGRQRSAANAITHGATSKKVLMPGESQEEYNAFSESIFRDYRPANEHEKLLARLVADTTWRYKRIIAAEEMVMAAGPEPEPGTEGTLASPENTVPVVQLFLRPSGQKSLNLMLRYVREAERGMFKARAELERIQKLRYQLEMERAAAGAYAAAAATDPCEDEDIASSAPPPPPPHEPGQEPAASQARTAAATVPPQLTRAERRAAERALRKAAKRANRAASSATYNQNGFVSATPEAEHLTAA